MVHRAVRGEMRGPAFHRRGVEFDAQPMAFRHAHRVVGLPERTVLDDVAHPGVVIVNQLMPRLFDKPALLDLLANVAVADVVAVGRRRVQREALETAQRDRLRALKLPLVEVPHLQESPLGPAHVARVSELLRSVS